MTTVERDEDARATWLVWAHGASADPREWQGYASYTACHCCGEVAHCRGRKYERMICGTCFPTSPEHASFVGGKSKPKRAPRRKKEDSIMSETTKKDLSKKDETLAQSVAGSFSDEAVAKSAVAYARKVLKVKAGIRKTSAPTTGLSAEQAEQVRGLLDA